MPEAVFLDPDDSGAAAWDDLWQRAPQRTPFTDRTFIRAAAAVTGWEPVLAAVQENARFVAGAVLYARPGDRLRRALPAPWTRYTGVLLDPPPHERHVLERASTLDALLGAVTGRFPIVSLSLTPENADARPLQWAGFDCAPRYTYRISGEYQPSRSVRRRLDKMAGFTVAAASPDDRPFNAMLQRHYRERGISPPLAADAQAAWLRALTDSGIATCHALRSAEGTLSAALVLLEDDRCTYTWLGGSLPGPALAILQHHAIETARSRGHTVDFLGANNASIAFFKSGFGGVLTQHYHALHYRSRVLRALGVLRPLA